MYISRIQINNFRMLASSTLYFQDENDNTCLMIGKNNSGKTSFLVLFEKFFNAHSFDYNDFSTYLRSLIDNFDNETDVSELAIQLILTIKYQPNDNLNNLSEFIMDLDPSRNDVNILFECTINKKRIMQAFLDNTKIMKSKFVRKYLSVYLERNVYIFDNDDDLKPENRYRLIKKEFDDVRRLIDFESIHAKRSVTSSEEKTTRRILSGLTTEFYNSLNSSSPNKFESINSVIEQMDIELEKQYDAFFKEFIRKARDFLSLDGLKVISNLKANEIVKDSSEVIYGDSSNSLPEYFNGLGYMNILYLLLTIEIKKSTFLTSTKDIKIFFIEEPEAHTHPQLQYVFAKQVETLLTDIQGLQTIITTHSPHIVAHHPFKNIRYMQVYKDKLNDYVNIIIKNFHQELSAKYHDEQEQFVFLKEYLSIESAELFFANKVIFIEGISESILLPYFISRFDAYNKKLEDDAIKEDPRILREYVSLSSQNVTILEVGANAKAFRYFLEFLGIKTLIITDIDTNKKETKSDRTVYKACAVSENPVRTSNATLEYFFSAPKFSADSNEYTTWLENLIAHTLTTSSDLIRISYQIEENNYKPRSFEDSFINVNRTPLKKHIDYLLGLQNKDEYDETAGNVYSITNDLIAKKSDFAASILYSAHTKGVNWNMPLYIWEGLEWLQKE